MSNILLIVRKNLLNINGYVLCTLDDGMLFLMADKSVNLHMTYVLQHKTLCQCI